MQTLVWLLKSILESLKFAWWWGVFLILIVLAKADPALPAAICDEPALKEWVESTIVDLPPEGGLVEMIKHWPPHYSKNDRVGEIWIVPALVKVTAPDHSFDHDMAFVVWHVDTGKTTVEVMFPVPEDQVPKYLVEPGQIRA